MNQEEEEQQELEQVLAASLQEEEERERERLREEAESIRVLIASEQTAQEEAIRVAEAADAAMFSAAAVNAEEDEDTALARAMEASLSVDGLTMLQKLDREAGPLPPGRCRRYVPHAKGAGGLLVGAQFKKALEIMEAVGGNCVIRFPRRSSGDARRGGSSSSSAAAAAAAAVEDVPDYLIVEADTSDAANRAEEMLNKHADTLVEKELRRPTNALRSAARLTGPAVGIGTLLAPRYRHVFVDNSNIFISAQTYNRPLGPDGRRLQDFAVRVKVDVLGQLLIRGAAAGTATPLLPGSRWAIGSKPRQGNVLWEHWKAAGFQTKAISRDNETGSETAVDNCLVAEILHCKSSQDTKFIGNNTEGNRPGENVLVMGGGDGNDNNGEANFYITARNFAHLGWRVEIWTFIHACSQRYLDLEEQHSVANGGDGRVTVHFLDEHAGSLLFRARDNVTPHIRHGPPSAPATGTASAPVLAAAAHTQAPAPVPAPVPEVDDECIVCMDAKRTHAFIPCGHRVACEACAEQVKSRGCPLCNRAVDSVLRVYT